MAFFLLAAKPSLITSSTKIKVNQQSCTDSTARRSLSRREMFSSEGAL